MSYLKNRKKMGLTILGVAAFAVAVAFNISAGLGSNAQMDVALANIEALATSEINPDCPNGCVDRSGGCHCYQDYSEYAEATW